MPRLLKDAKPNYTPDAMRRSVQGHVMLAAIVDADGVVQDLCVQKGIDPDLDATAAGAGRAFQFAPGTLNGEPVAVRVAIEMSFTLRR
jgi:protein TonB